MGLIELVIVLIVVGVLLWLLDQMPFLDAQIKTIIRFIVIVVVVLWLLRMFVGDVTLPRIR
jgi:hypothetical protein